LQIPPEFLVFDTAHWAVNHRINSALPGYLMVASKRFTGELSELSPEALTELGPLLARVQRAVTRILQPRLVYIGRYGHTPGYPIHFHVIPICEWVEELFWADTRYRLLEKFADSPGQAATDGAELTLFVWREFCERIDPPQIKGPAISEVIESLREAMLSS
jgi:diadenosine tetraphosphate (Ap4A) HIT family hydrolase